MAKNANSFEISQDRITPEVVQALNSLDLNDQLSGVEKLEEFLSYELVPSVEDLVESRITLRLTELIYTSTDDLLKTKATHVSNIIAARSADHRKLANELAVPFLVNGLNSGSNEEKEEYLCILGCLADEDVYYRDFILDHGILDTLLALISSPTKLPVVTNATRLLYYLCQGLHGYPDYKKVATIYPIATSLLTHNDNQILIYACETLCSLAIGCLETNSTPVSEIPFDRLISLLTFHSLDVVDAALNALSQIAKSKSRCEQLLKYMPVLINSPQGSIRVTACEIITAMTAGNRTEKQINDVINAELYPIIIDLINKGHPETLCQAARAVTTAVMYGTADQLKYLISIGCISCLCGILKRSNIGVLDSALDSVARILSLGRFTSKLKARSTNSYANAIRTCRGVDSLIELQNHPDVTIKSRADYIIKKYFSQNKK